MKQLYIVVCLFVVAACAHDIDAESNVSDTSAESSDAGSRTKRPTEIDFAKLADFPIDKVVGLYHLLDRADAINLELTADHKFRWSLQGCDTRGGDRGRFKLVTPTSIALLPEDGKPSFFWSTLGTREETEIRMDVDAGKLFEPIMIGGVRMQIWDRGGVCPICGGGFGPTGQEACDEPDFED